MKKIAFYGNSCTGKTTSLYEIANYLTKKGHSFRIVNMPFDNSGHVKNDKPFSPMSLESSWQARAYFLHEQLAMEAKAYIQDDVDFLLCEMTVMDLFYMVEWVSEMNNKFPNGFDSLRDYCKLWMPSYGLVFKMQDGGYYHQTTSRAKGTFVKDGLRTYYDKYEGSFSCNSIEIFGKVEDRSQMALQHFSKTFGV